MAARDNRLEQLRREIAEAAPGEAHTRVANCNPILLYHPAPGGGGDGYANGVDHWRYDYCR